MKHATPIALDALEPLLDSIRALDGLIEKRRGVFYRRSSAFLHFHEDPAGAVFYAVTQPIGVNVFEIVVRPPKMLSL